MRGEKAKLCDWTTLEGMGDQQQGESCIKGGYATPMTVVTE